MKRILLGRIHEVAKELATSSWKHSAGDLTRPGQRPGELHKPALILKFVAHAITRLVGPGALPFRGGTFKEHWTNGFVMCLQRSQLLSFPCSFFGSLEKATPAFVATSLVAVLQSLCIGLLGER